MFFLCSKLNVAVRQASCQNNSNCYPLNITGIGLNIPSGQVSCGLQGQCVCSGNCFTLNGSICGYSKCGWYDPNSATCNSLAKSQTTAFLLSLFVSSLGVANFYIGQNGLGMCKVTYYSIACIRGIQACKGEGLGGGLITIVHCFPLIIDVAPYKPYSPLV